MLVYGAVSCWMYVIGMGAAIFTGEYDIAVIMVKAGLGIAALVILVFFHRYHDIFGCVERGHFRRVACPPNWTAKKRPSS